MLVLYDRALREARADVDDRVVAVVEPDAAELKIRTVTRLQTKHIAVEPLDRENTSGEHRMLRCRKPSNFMVVLLGNCLVCYLKSYHKRLRPESTQGT